MDAAYFEAAIPEPFQILGLRLKPLSLGRYRLLKRFDVAFVAEGEAKATVSDLILGLVICSMKCQEFLALLDGPGFAKEIRCWSRKICPHPWIGFLPCIGKRWRDQHSFNILEKIMLFNRYIQQAQQVPAYWSENESEQQSGAHWSQAMEVVLRGKLGWTREEIEEQPLTKAMADYFKWAENEGALRLIADGELDGADENARILAVLN